MNSSKKSGFADLMFKAMANPEIQKMGERMGEGGEGCSWRWFGEQVKFIVSAHRVLVCI